MLYREIIAVCSEIHTKHINTLCGQNEELLNVKHGGTYSNHCASAVLPPQEPQQRPTTRMKLHHHMHPFHSLDYLTPLPASQDY
jgi:hypothetical protein